MKVCSIMTQFNVSHFNAMVEDEIVRPLVKAVIINQPDVYRNTLDPFSAMVDCAISGCSHSEWMQREVARQSQKTLQNKVGNFHESVIGCFEGWENLPVGNVIDIVNGDERVIAEIKNKHNTTKGNHKKEIYDDLESLLSGEYEGYQAYYVEVLPKNRDVYNECFTPSDNVTGRNRPARDDIRKIDGKSFYGIVSGDTGFVHRLYNKYLPEALVMAIDSVNKDYPGLSLPRPGNFHNDEIFHELIKNTFS